MIKVALVGTGAVSTHLKEVFSNAPGVDLVQVIQSRGNTMSKTLKSHKKDGNEEQIDIYIIAVSDDAIHIVSEQFKDSNQLIVHTSGSVSMEALPKEVRSGVFYPLQTFSKDRKVDFKTIPICIEASENNDLELLRRLAASISDSVYKISSEQRKSLHLAAVFINNFTNHLYHIGSEICEINRVPFEVLKPLLLETAKKAVELSPINAQTGPAVRNDSKTIEKQLDQLKNENQRSIYKVLTKSIIETHGKKL